MGKKSTTYRSLLRLREDVPNAVCRLQYTHMYMCVHTQFTCMQCCFLEFLNYYYLMTHNRIFPLQNIFCCYNYVSETRRQCASVGMPKHVFYADAHIVSASYFESVEIMFGNGRGRRTLKP